MKKTISILLTLCIAAGLLLAGCSGSPSEPSGGGAAQTDGQTGQADRQMVAGVPSITSTFNFFRVAAGFESISFGAA